MSKDLRYFNFPIQLISGFMANPNKCLSDIANYAVYEHSLKMNNSKELERFEVSADYYGIKFSNTKNSLSNGKLLYNSIPTKSPKVGLSTQIYWDFYKNDKTEFDKICLLGFLALKSIVQKKACCKTNNKLWLARMDGKKTIKEFSDLSSSIAKYNNEYQTVKIKNDLRINWGLITYSRYTKGFYISFKINLDSLVYYAENNRTSNKIKQLKASNKLALDKALLRINNTTNARP
jgi:hypothetical protein